MTPLKVYVIDDHEVVRQALVTRLCSTANILLVGETANAEDGLLEILALRPDVVLIETKRADGRGLELVSWVAQCGRNVKVVVLTSYPSEWEKWAAYRAGAALYLLKDIGSPSLVEEIRTVTHRPAVPVSH